jgi:hypothetical protein
MKYFNFIYELGRKINLSLKVKSWDEKFSLVEFEYTSSEVLSGAAIFLAAFVLIGLILSPIQFFSYLFIFIGLVIPIGAVLWASSINYSQKIVSFKEEMLQALLEISNHVLLNTSIEAALVYSAENIKGTLGKQLRSIKEKIETKQITTLGEALEEYIPLWLKINPDFVKGLNLLQTAAIAPKNEREKIIEEVIETVIISYHDSGKRLTEKLTGQTNGLISMGVTLPMISLILLPLLTIFMPQIANFTLLLFIYAIFFPTIILFLSMNFATNRVQVNTIDMSSSPLYKKTPPIFYLIAVGIAIIMIILPIAHLMTINLNTTEGVQREYSLVSLVIIWSGLLGLVIAIEIFCYSYFKRNEKLWLELEEIERDIPNLLQIISSYLSLNRSMESIFSDIVSDYKHHGFGSHPTVKIITNLKDSLYNTKRSLLDLTESYLPKIAPSKRMSSIFRRIVLFSEIDMKSASKSAKMIRAQTISIYELDDYIQTLLAETVSVVSMTTTMLAPLLATAAIIMSAAIVMSLQFIKEKINGIVTSVGGQAIEMEFIKITQIIPPTMLEIIVGLFFIEMSVILSIFLSTIKNGTDKYKIAKTIYENLLTAFILFSVMLIIGYLAFTEIIFKGVLLG